MQHVGERGLGVFGLVDCIGHRRDEESLGSVRSD